jgi:outer membrane protein assembly factor BamA
LASIFFPLQLQEGHVFNIEAGKQALRNINSLGLFSNIEVNPKPDEKSEGGIIVEIKLKELDQKSAEVSTEWSIVPGRQGRPTLVSFLTLFLASYEILMYDSI